MFWNIFLELCNSRKISPTKVVCELGLGRGSVTNWKNGSIPNDSTLLKIANYFGVTMAYLKGEEKTPVEEPTSETMTMFWSIFVELCNKNGIKPNPLAKSLGISSGAVTRWKNGSIPNDTAMLKIANYFGVTLEYLKGKESGFKKIFVDLCNEKGVTPTAVCKSVGLSNAAFSAWKDDTTPRYATLVRIANYFGVTVEYLKGTTKNATVTENGKAKHCDRLQHALELREMKPSKLSYKSGISEASISHYLAGHYVPKTDKMEKMAKALHVSSAWLSGYDVPMNDEAENEIESSGAEVVYQCNGKFKMFKLNSEQKKMFDFWVKSQEES